MSAGQIVEILLGEKVGVETVVAEVSVHRPRRSKVWVATFTGPTPGQQVWRSVLLWQRCVSARRGRRRVCGSDPALNRT
jgi:hypothetical protein